MVAGAASLGQRQIACDHELLSQRRESGQAEIAGNLAFVHNAARERWIFAMLDDRPIERGEGFKCGGHQCIVSQPVTVIAEGHRPGLGQRAEVRQLLSGAALAEASDRVHPATAHLLRLLEYALHHVGCVDWRCRVRHAGHGREAPGDGSGGARLDGLFVLAARLTKMDVHVDQSGNNEQAGGVDDPLERRLIGPAGRNHASCDREVGRRVVAAAGVHNVAALDQNESSFRHTVEDSR